MKEVKLIRIISGEEIITEVLDSGDEYLVIKNPLVVIPQQGQVGFAPWATVIDTERPEIGLDMKHVIYSVEVAEAVADQYNQIFGNKIITTPEEKKLIL